MIITTTPTLDKFQITQYLGIVTGADTYIVGGLIGEGFLKQNSLFRQAVSTARKQLESAASEMGADAVVGVLISSTSMASTGNIIVTATGTAVKIEQTGWNDELPEI